MKRKIVIFQTVCIVVFAGIALSLSGAHNDITPSKKEGSGVTHVSAYFKEAGYIETQTEKFENVEAIAAQYLMGGVVPHHIPTAIPLLVEFYAKLQKSKQVDTFIILGPDHFERGEGDVSFSKAPFLTPFGRLKPDLALLNKLEEQTFAVHDELPFNDHSIHSQMLLIGKFFPKAKVVPIVFRSSSTNEMAESFGEFLASIATPNTFIIASVDFSHYLPEEQARPLDEQSAYSLTFMEPKLAGLVEADSPQSLVAMMAAVKSMGATSSLPMGTFNSASVSNNKDSTTGYVLQFFGVPIIW